MITSNKRKNRSFGPGIVIFVLYFIIKALSRTQKYGNFIPFILPLLIIITFVYVGIQANKTRGLRNKPTTNQTQHPPQPADSKRNSKLFFIIIGALVYIALSIFIYFNFIKS